MHTKNMFYMTAYCQWGTSGGLGFKYLMLDSTGAPMDV